MAEKGKRQYLLALDSGGTMTDTFLMDMKGKFIVGKHLTNRANESVSYIGSVKDACDYWGLSTSEVHRSAIASIYAGTGMINVLLTRTGRKIGLLITRGFEHNTYIERGLTWLGQSLSEQSNYLLHKHTEPLVELRNVKPITERITGGNYFPPGSHYPAGKVVIPLAEGEVRAAVAELLDAGVEVIGILFLHSYCNPEHEKKAAKTAEEVINRRGVKATVVCSSDICPRSRESARMKTLLVECYAAVPTREQLLRVEEKAKEDGFTGQLQTFLSYGAVANIRYSRLCESVMSGPVGGILGGKFLGDVKGWQSLICCDLGGTSFDAGLISKGMIEIKKEPNLAGHRLNLPMIAIESIGAGTGMEIHVDPLLKRISLGPISAGSKVGVCLEHPDITISDVNVALGYLSADYFLGGKVKLNRERAIRALEDRLARPLGMSVYDAGFSVLDLMHSQLRDHIAGTVSARGFTPDEYTLLMYGGSGPLHMWGVVEGMKLGAVATVPWAAAFSAFGIATAEHFHRYERTVNLTLPAFLPAEAKLQAAMALNKAWEELEESAYQEFEREGFSRDNVTFRYGISAHYLGQLFSSWDSPVEKGRIHTFEDVNSLIASFEKAYLTIYPTAARFPEAGYHIVNIFIEAAVPRIKAVLADYPLRDKKPDKAYKGQREVYWRGRWIKFGLFEMDRLEAGNRVEGPAIIEHPMTTLPVPPGRYIELDEHKVIWYH